MTHDFTGRRYTDAAGRILAEVVEAVALRWWAPQGIEHHARRATIEAQTAHAMGKARAEQDRMAGNPLTASIDRVDAIIRHKCGGQHDSVLRDNAILAHHEGRAAVLVRHYHPSARLAANAVHDGDDLGRHMIQRCRDERRGLRTYGEAVLAVLLPVNQQAVDAIEVGAWALAERADRPRYLEAAE